MPKNKPKSGMCPKVKAQLREMDRRNPWGMRARFRRWHMQHLEAYRTWNKWRMRSDRAKRALNGAPAPQTKADKYAAEAMARLMTSPDLQ